MCGFAEDRDYLGPVRSRLVAALFPVSAAVAEERDPERHMMKTARALAASRRLGLVSVWHPSAFLRLLDFMSGRADEVSDDPRVRRLLAARDFRGVWPRLKLISCWDAAFAAADAEKVRAAFPGVEVEGKGLMATEGVVTVPWFGKRVAAVTSHSLSFERVDETSGEPIEGTAVGVERLEKGKRYGVVLTTGNGFTVRPTRIRSAPSAASRFKATAIPTGTTTADATPAAGTATSTSTLTATATAPATAAAAT